MSTREVEEWVKYSQMAENLEKELDNMGNS